MWERIAERLVGQIVVLEPLERRHQDGLRSAAADERIWRFMVTTDVEIWLARAFAEQESGARIQFAGLRGGDIVGSARLMRLGPEHPPLQIRHNGVQPS